jgi:hypothetical protein
MFSSFKCAQHGIVTRSNMALLRPIPFLSDQNRKLLPQKFEVVGSVETVRVRKMRMAGKVFRRRWWGRERRGELIDFPFMTPENRGERKSWESEGKTKGTQENMTMGVNNDHFQHTRLNSNYIFYVFPSSKVVFYVLSFTLFCLFAFHSCSENEKKNISGHWNFSPVIAK